MGKGSRPALVSDLHALADLYRGVFREMGRQMVSGHGWPPHRHSLPLSARARPRAEKVATPRR